MSTTTDHILTTGNEKDPLRKRHDCSPEEIQFVKNLLNPDVRSNRAAFKDAFECEDWALPKIDGRANILKKSQRIQAALKYYTGRIKEADELSRINDRQFVLNGLRFEAIGKGAKGSTSTSRIRALELIGKESGMKFDGSLPGEEEESKSVAQVEQKIVDLLTGIESKLAEMKDPVANAIDVTAVRKDEIIPVGVSN